MRKRGRDGSCSLERVASARYLLPPHVVARRHVVTRGEGGADTFVVLHDRGERGPRTHRIGPREWALLEGMDGTRDIEGLVSRAGRRGAAIGLEHARAFVGELAREGLVVEASSGADGAGESSVGEARLSSAAAAAGRAPFGARPIEVLPGYRLRCDGRGSCCRLYPSIVFSPLDAARARAAMPEVDGGGEDEARVFLPESGARRDVLAVTLVDGRCAYLGGDGLCGIHRASGAGAKPFGCRSFPLALVDDGAAVRVTPAVECACVVASAVGSDEGGDALLDPAIVDASSLDPRLYVDVLPASIDLSREHACSRSELVAWSRAIEDVAPVNAVAAMIALSSHVRAGRLDAESARAELLSTSVPEGALSLLEPRIARLRARLRVRSEESWRGDADLAARAFVAMGAAAELAEEALGDLVGASPRTAAEEAFYVRVGLYGHHFVTRSLRRPLADTLLDRATRLVLGRALAVVAAMTDLRDPAFSAPLALVEAVLRGHGLAAYALDLD